MFERGELLLVPYLFTDLSTTKRRPVMALTRPDTQGDFIALPVTSRPQRDNAMALSAGSMIRGNLPLASWVRTDRVVTLHVSLVVKAFGQVASTITAMAAARLCHHIGHRNPSVTGDNATTS